MSLARELHSNKLPGPLLPLVACLFRLEFILQIGASFVLTGPLLKALGLFLSDEDLCMMTDGGWGLVDRPRMGAHCQKDRGAVRGPELSAPSPNGAGMEGGLGLLMASALGS